MKYKTSDSSFLREANAQCINLYGLHPDFLQETSSAKGAQGDGPVRKIGRGTGEPSTSGVLSGCFWGFSLLASTGKEPSAHVSERVE